MVHDDSSRPQVNIKKIRDLFDTKSRDSSEIPDNGLYLNNTQIVRPNQPQRTYSNHSYDEIHRNRPIPTQQPPQYQPPSYGINKPAR